MKEHVTKLKDDIDAGAANVRKIMLKESEEIPIAIKDKYCYKVVQKLTKNNLKLQLRPEDIPKAY